MDLIYEGITTPTSTASPSNMARVRMDLIYEGITTHAFNPLHDSVIVRMDLIYEGITTRISRVFWKQFVVRMDLIYEGITTPTETSAIQRLEVSEWT